MPEAVEGMRTAGIVLAAGASSRMGSPKALLEDKEGIPLAVRQAEALRRGGCDWVAVVIGAKAEAVRMGLPAGLATAENPAWATGRATSLQAGVGAFPAADGYLFLPVDAAGTRAETVGAVLAAAAAEPEKVWRPTHGGRKGNLLWVPRGAAAELMRLPADARVDEWAKPLAREIEVADPGIVRKANTPEEWGEWVGEVGGGEGKAGGGE